MRLCVAGVVHNDPLGRQRLKNWFNNLQHTESQLPSFVAVEWDEYTLGRVIAQRPRFIALAQRFWPAATSEYVQVLTKSLGYEGDSHVEVFPSVNTLWLDEGRDYNNDDVEDFSELRLTTYKRFAEGLSNFDSAALEAMSVTAWHRAPRRQDDHEPRDDIFASKLLAASRVAENNWAIAVLGFNHTADLPGRAIHSLKQAGLTCQVDVLCPDEIVF